MDGGILCLHVGSLIVLSASLEGPLPITTADCPNSLSVSQSRLAFLRSGVSPARCCYQFGRLVPQSVNGTMCPLAPRSLAVLALRESCAGRGTGDSAPHLVRPAGLPIIVPAVLGLTVPHPALVFHLTSPRPEPVRARTKSRRV